MAQINYVPSINNYYQSQGFPPYKWSEFDTSPWTPFEKPLNQACIGLVTSAGIFKDGQEPFDPWAVNDLSLREVPVDTPFEKLRLNHNYFDHRDALKDFNCVYPVHRLKELEESGFIGSLSPKAVTLGMGRLYMRKELQEETVPKIVESLKSQGVDGVLLVPA
ncbi:MAG: glycine/sarcosine/betaine reductase selenoprotein B family protein [Thermodesulfobacteriota bacterium]|nr:glycine/sarcosine/betaine reductase selenoprotein B family protein [Thermodesulfobacteriota bacterium]